MESQNRNSGVDCGRRIDIVNTIRRLWFEHTIWTNQYITSAVDELGDVEETKRRLLQNPKDFSAELQKYYGPQNAKRFGDLLTQHLVLAAELVAAAKQGDAAQANAVRRRWYQNAEDIATFLAGINPFWSKKVWQDMMFMHLRFVEYQAVLRLTKDYARWVTNFDQMEAQILEMADVMAAGIIRQFNL